MFEKSFVNDFWENQAVIHKQDHSASWGDNWAMDLEIKNIGQYIKQGDAVLDVGCANGYSSFRQFEKKPSCIHGVDYSQSMIKYANQVKGEHPFKEVFDFRVGDVRELPHEDNMYDVVYTTRVLINLHNWQEQRRGIDECIRVCKKGGAVIFSETFWEPLMKLNAIRTLCGLESLVEHDFNRYLKKSNLENYFTEQGIDFSCTDFSSVYYLGSRFLRELVTEISKYPGYSNPINKWFYELEQKYSGGGFGIQQSYVVKK